MFDLTGRIAVVTGASSGIGQGTAAALAAAGADVAGFQLPDADGAARTTELVERAGRRALMVDGDTSDAAAVEAFAERVEAELGPIDVWVNNAARLLVRPFLEMSDAEWRGVLDVNLDGYYHGCRSALRRMVPRRAGRIVNVSSITASQPISDLSAYVAAKGGVIGLTRALALEFGPQGIGVNAVAPGAIETALNAHVYTPEVRRTYEQRIAVGRIGLPPDVAGAVVFLASDAAAYVTGQELTVDGGMTLNGNVGFAVDPEESAG
ncbi:MAG TPA: SDR family NAD(P)-dependent oxidoreductase [Conexibacter sp.]|nr:SDR family NAD(P)-dependent oxidoreductase [Conexibacter sp.]